MSYLSKPKQSTRSCGSWVFPVILSLLLMSAISCKKTGTIIFYENPNASVDGRAYYACFNNTNGTVKWDDYDLNPKIGEKTISSLDVFTIDPTTLILCENIRFKGAYAKIPVQPKQWTTMNLVDYGFNDRTSSVIVTYEVPPSLFNLLTHVRIELKGAIEPFREGIKKIFVESKSLEHAYLYDTQILWDTELNFRTQYLGSQDYSESLKNNDLIQFYQYLKLDPNWWPFDYKVKLRFWLKPTNISGEIGFDKVGWHLWVEEGSLQKRIDGEIGKQMDGGLQDLASNLKKVIIDKIGDLAKNIQSISFTLPDPSDTSKFNQFAGAPLGTIESMPPIIILEQKGTAADAAKDQDRLGDGAMPPGENLSNITSLPIPAEDRRPITDRDRASHIAGTFGPEITNNIKKLGFKNEDEYREKLLKDLGISKENEKNTKIYQMTDNGVIGLSITSGGTGGGALPPTGQADKPPIELDKKALTLNEKVVKTKLEELFKKMETSSSISISQVNQLLTLMNEATRLGIMKPKYQKRYKNLILTKAKRYKK